MNNGGYSQFFLNSNEHVDVIVEALEQIRCPTTAAITAKAIGALGISNLTPDAVYDAMDVDDQRRDALLEECDDDYFGGDEPIADRLFRYIELNSSEVRLP